MTTIHASLVAAGVGLPPVWRRRSMSGMQGYEITVMYSPSVDDTVTLTDPQTAFGVALRLDEWTCAAPGFKQQSRHLKVLAEHFVAGQWDDVARGYLNAMALRVEQIGRDHRIRRKLGWIPEPGTLWPLVHEDGVRRLIIGDTGASVNDARWAEAVAAVRRPSKALRAIDEALS